MGSCDDWSCRDPREGTEVIRASKTLQSPWEGGHTGWGRYGDSRGLWKMFAAGGFTPCNRKGSPATRPTCPPASGISSSHNPRGPLLIPSRATEPYLCLCPLAPSRGQVLETMEPRNLWFCYCIEMGFCFAISPRLTSNSLLNLPRARIPDNQQHPTWLSTGILHGVVSIAVEEAEKPGG